MNSFKFYYRHFFYVFLSFLFFFSQESHATHIMGGDLSYECTSTSSTSSDYRVTLKVYRDCNGINPGSYSITYTTDNCGSNNVSMSKISVTEITTICPGSTGTACNGSGIYGIEEHVYEGMITIPSTCTGITIYWRSCCRNGAISTLSSPLSENMYIKTIIPDASVCNNSPTFLNNPVPIICANQPVFYNHGAVDTDGDDLSFSLVSCLDNNNIPVAYSPGFSATNPLSTLNGITIDSTTGSIKFTPTIPQVGVLCVLVEEYRNGVKVGEIVSDIQFTIITCYNDNPTASGINNTTSYSTNLPIGTNLCFDIFSNDTNTGDVVSMYWNAGIPGGTYTVDNSGTFPKGTFCWTPTVYDVGTNVFTVTIADDNCPLVGQNTYTYSIEVSSTTIQSVSDGDWSTPGTWDCNCVPISSHNIIIDHNVTMNCDFTVDNGAYMTVNGSIEIASTFALTIEGVFNNYNTITGVGDLILAGTNSKFVRLGEVENVETSNSEGILIANYSTINRKLTLSTGYLNSNSYDLILKSDVQGTALVVDNGGSFFGELIVQRYVENISGHHFISSPVANATIDEFTDDINVIINNTYPSIYYYDETIQDDHSEVGWTAPTTLSHPMTPGSGMTVYFNASNGVNLDIKGEFNRGQVCIPLNSTPPIIPYVGNCPPDGWNLIGNPYPSPIDFNLLIASATSVENALYVWDPITESYFSYIANVSSPAGFGNIIPSMQAFWVRATAGSTLCFEDAMRITDPNIVTNDFYKNNNSNNNPLLRVEVNGQNLVSEAVFTFKENATPNFDYKYDARVMGDGVTNDIELASTSNGGLLKINSYPKLQADEVLIPLYTYLKNAGSYQFSISQFDNFGIKDEVYLEDHVLGVSHELITPYAFSSLANTGTNRFSLRMVPDDNTSVAEIENRNIHIYKSNDLLYVNLPQTANEDKILNIYNSIGQLVFTTNLQAGQQNYHLEVFGLEGSNIYLVELQGIDSTFKIAW